MRNLLVFIAAALALWLGVTGGYALAGGSSSSGAEPGPAVISAPTSPGPTATATAPASLVTPRPSTTAQPTPDPTALADGTYPAYVRAVDVQRATITVDVVQVFVGSAHTRRRSRTAWLGGMSVSIRSTSATRTRCCGRSRSRVRSRSS